MKLNKLYFKFIIIFFISYTIISIFFLKIIGQQLINLQKNIIQNIFPNLINFNQFIFVPECSGIITISIFLSLIIATTTYKNNLNRIKPFKQILYIGLITIILLILNIIRITIVLMSSRISLSFAKVTHVIFWFVLGLVIYFIFTRYIKKNKLYLNK